MCVGSGAQGVCIGAGECVCPMSARDGRTVPVCTALINTGEWACVVCVRPSSTHVSGRVVCVVCVDLSHCPHRLEATQ